MRYKEATTENLTEVFKEAIKKALEEDKGLFIYGNTGVGKTYAMHALTRINGGDVENFVSLLSEFKDYFNKGDYFGNLKMLTSKDRLFIDDIGAEKMSDFVQEFLYLIINRRYENMKRTVLSTNLTLDDFRERYGDRLLSRIAEMCLLVELKGEDRRI